MKKTWILILLLFSGMSLAIETCDYVDESDEVSEEDAAMWEELTDDSREMDDDERWLINLNNHLMQHDDINVAIVALNAMRFHQNRVDPETDLPVYDVKIKQQLLKNVSESINASSDTLMLAMSMCQEEQFESHCSVETIMDQLIKLTPENINIYMYDLAAAVRDHDAEMIDLILDRMSKAKHSHYMIKLPESLKKELDMYQLDYPNPMDLESELIEQLGVDISKVDMKQLSQQFLLLTYHTLGNSNYPAFQPLMSACSDYENQVDHCLAIAKTLQESSDSALMTMIGFNLEVKVQEQFGDEKALESSQLKNEAYSEYYQCLFSNQIKQQSMDYVFDSVLLNLMIESTQEGKAIEQSAVYLYEKYKEKGIEDLKNPKECGLRYIN